MPELPEVETVKRGLTKNIISKKIKSVQINTDKLRYPVDKAQLLSVKNKVVKNIQRRGKHLIIYLEDNLQLIIHLGMSGVVKIINTSEYNKIKHDHIILELSDDLNLVYNDPRKFGYWLVNTNMMPLEHRVLATHGVEPLTDDFNAEYLISKLKKTSRKIKQTIMDNSIVVGVGNIYASEALFDSNILPTRASNTITKKEAERLVTSIKKILDKAIAEGGTTLKDYKNTEGKPGYFTQQLNVYGRANQNCYICSTKIESLVIAQRNTFFCKKCQR
ncbi:bifunctional DNA-formamidopyrimidine glycosylase/DNA-(apurinic or apyrimidinic site) lyase [Francisella philomiragia]|uniref:Formamidopyrimidine-DNA glycosylase n=1 Tax=Francisella philomiragia TaxID=28110 RepID=A0AAW3DD90_9GAMM|nr:bifunctional DNA-formamidopyrimidine glycosylase/DNA-(apurinic or apyrimidinic site) lyase [Francisella philomiragia]KFJ43417.1 formamidopyrimidine-DNA glycosylase [Francisella philomiragia]MBK2255469.1 bifunctional DNA-formamidopyrimidine glycosylase/DNA-(apurinic or apyrimidinic site) lyase [Francisella philomiragia]MBK2273791.1 bifunctional DNA-formamidopyrimidine glycosylase/DNA-(apurinic or apyrimidinic site) lyase [Francisella philomiragia]MBK2277663.1 bifunctional DNA-formamidopyrimid